MNVFKFESPRIVYSPLPSFLPFDLVKDVTTRAEEFDVYGDIARFVMAIRDLGFFYEINKYRRSSGGYQGKKATS